MMRNERVATATKGAADVEGVVIHHSGQDFTASVEMAEIFYRRSREVLAGGRAELVPLLHRGGVELLLVCPVDAVETSALATTVRLVSPIPPEHPHRPTPC